MSQARRRLIGFLSAAVVISALAFGARELLASSRMASCEDCDETTDCDQCCRDWQMGEFGICPMGGGSCLCGG